MTTLLTNKNYRDNHDNDWRVIASKTNPIIKNYMDLIIKTIKNATELLREQRKRLYTFTIQLLHYNVESFLEVISQA